MSDELTQPAFQPGDRVFTHYDMAWGTIESVSHTDRGATHGVTGSPLPDTTWYDVVMDKGGLGLYDDAHGDWDMARIVPPKIAKRYGYGDDPIQVDIGMLEDGRYWAIFRDPATKTQIASAYGDTEPEARVAAAKQLAGR